MNARLALDRLHHHGGRRLPHRRPQGVRVVAGHDHEPRRQRPEEVLAGEPRSGGEGGEGAAVEGVVEDDDLGAIDVPRMSVPADQLDRAFVRLRARVAEEGAAAERRFDQPLGQDHRGLGVEEVRGPAERRGLLADRGDDRRIAVAGVVDRQAAEQVDVGAAIRVPEDRALTADELDRETRVRRHRVARLDRLELIECGPAHGVTLVPIPASVNSSSSRL